MLSIVSGELSHSGYAKILKFQPCDSEQLKTSDENRFKSIFLEYA